MIYWLGIIVAVVLTIIVNKILDTDELPGFLMLVLVGAMWAALFVATIYMASEYIGLNGKIAGYEQRYSNIIYQAENHLYDDDINLSKKALADQITEWNCDLAKRKAHQNDFWIGVFVPDIYDRFEFIPMELMGDSQ